MTAALGGLGAAFVWSLGNLFAARAAHALGPLVTLAWVTLVGLLVVALALAVHPAPAPPTDSLLWLALGGIGNAGGLLVLYCALRVGPMGVVMPLVSTEGGLAALIAVMAGQAIDAITATAMVVVVIGAVMVSVVRAGGVAIPSRRRFGLRHEWSAPALAALTAVCMGVSTYATGRAGRLVPLAVAVLPPRLFGVIAVTAPLALRGRLGFPARELRWLAIAGVCEVGGFVLYTTGARQSIAVAAVLASLTGAIGAAWGRVAFAERLRSLQVLGVVVIFAGVAVLSATTR